MIHRMVCSFMVDFNLFVSDIFPDLLFTDLVIAHQHTPNAVAGQPHPFRVGRWYLEKLTLTESAAYAESKWTVVISNGKDPRNQKENAMRDPKKYCEGILIHT
jgi:hypothetical protein